MTPGLSPARSHQLLWLVLFAGSILLLKLGWKSSAKRRITQRLETVFPEALDHRERIRIAHACLKYSMMGKLDIVLPGAASTENGMEEFPPDADCLRLPDHFPDRHTSGHHIEANVVLDVVLGKREPRDVSHLVWVECPGLFRRRVRVMVLPEKLEDRREKTRAVLGENPAFFRWL